MSKRFFALLLVAVLALGLLAGCTKSKIISADEAIKIALKDMGISEKDATTHVHIAEGQADPSYGVYITYNGKTFLYVINAATKEIVTKGETNHTH